MKLEVKKSIHPVTNATVYDLVSSQLYLDNSQFFDVLENVVITTTFPIITFIVVVVSTSVTVVQLKRVIVWRLKAGPRVERTEFESHSALLCLSDKNILLRKN